MNKLTLRIAADHPSGIGHFPGNPVIPGALLLAEVLHCIARAEGLLFPTCNVKAAKFPHPVRPGDSVEIEYSCSARGVVDFRCAVTGIHVLSGTLGATTDA